jgi:four helix bundle protein
MTNEIHFRFEDLEIWKDSVSLVKELFTIIDSLHEQKKYRVSQQLEGAALSISNNIAEGAGSKSGSEFKRYLVYARSSIFECANIIYVLFELGILEMEIRDHLLDKLDHISRKIYLFSKTISN